MSSSDDQLSRDLASLRIDRGDSKASAPSAGTKRSYSWVIGVAIALAVVFGIWKYVIPSATSQVFKAEVAFTEISSVSPAQASVEVTSTGYVVPQVVAKVGSKVIGRIAKVNVKEGVAVKAGDVLFELDPSDQRTAVAAANAKVASAVARVQSARANLAEVEIQYNRQKALADKGAVGAATADDLAARVLALKEQVKAQEADVAAAQADMAALNVVLKQTTITSPIDGVPVTKPAQVGDVVNPTAGALVEIVDPSSLLVETDVPEARVSKIHVGGPAEIILDAEDGKRFRGVVAEFGPRINRSKATATVKVRFREPPASLRQDMAARVNFLSKELGEAEMKQAEKVIVPDNAIVSKGDGKVVWVVENEKIRVVPIEVGEPFGSGFVLKRGPAAGTRVVRDPLPTLQDGQSVKEKGK